MLLETLATMILLDEVLQSKMESEILELTSERLGALYQRYQSTGDGWISTT